MEVFRKLLDNVINVKDRLPSIVIDVALSQSAEIIDANVGQLQKGLTNKGDRISPGYRSDEYARFKQSIGSQAPLGTPDLILEGDFTEAFYVEKRGDGLLIDSRDDKTSKLEGKYEGIFGLTKESKEDLNVIPEVIKIIENEITK